MSLSTATPHRSFEMSLRTISLTFFIYLHECMYESNTVLGSPRFSDAETAIAD